MSFYRIDRLNGNGWATEGFYDAETGTEIRVWDNQRPQDIIPGTRHGWGAVANGNPSGNGHYRAEPVPDCEAGRLEDVVDAHKRLASAPTTGPELIKAQTWLDLVRINLVMELPQFSGCYVFHERKKNAADVKNPITLPS